MIFYLWESLTDFLLYGLIQIDDTDKYIHVSIKCKCIKYSMLKIHISKLFPYKDDLLIYFIQTYISSELSIQVSWLTTYFSDDVIIIMNSFRLIDWFWRARSCKCTSTYILKCRGEWIRKCGGFGDSYSGPNARTWYNYGKKKMLENTRGGGCNPFSWIVKVCCWVFRGWAWGDIYLFILRHCLCI